MRDVAPAWIGAELAAGPTEDRGEPVALALGVGATAIGGQRRTRLWKVDLLDVWREPRLLEQRAQRRRLDVAGAVHVMHQASSRTQLAEESAKVLDVALVRSARVEAERVHHEDDVDAVVGQVVDRRVALVAALTHVDSRYAGRGGRDAAPQRRDRLAVDVGRNYEARRSHRARSAQSEPPSAATDVRHDHPGRECRREERPLAHLLDVRVRRRLATPVGRNARRRRRDGAWRVVTRGLATPEREQREPEYAHTQCVGAHATAGYHRPSERRAVEALTRRDFGPSSAVAKRPMIDTHVPEEALELGPSRTQKRDQRRRTQDSLDDLAKLLASMPPKSLAALDLEPGLFEAVSAFKTIPPGSANVRQRRLVARLLREHDIEALQKRALLALGASSDDGGRAYRLETWRTRLLDEGDAALAELCLEHPDADRQQLRQAVRAAVAERAEAKSTRRQKALYQLLKSLGEPVAETPTEGS